MPTCVLALNQALSEVDISDADDIKVLANDPDGAVLVHLGSSDYLDRYKIYVAHVREWRQQAASLTRSLLSCPNHNTRKGTETRTGIANDSLKCPDLSYKGCGLYTASPKG